MADSTTDTSEEGLELSPDVIEPASSGRSKCRGCGEKIPKDELRFGEKGPNPFGDGEATYWFHVKCAAYRRPERFARMEALPEELEDADKLREVAEAGVAHHRLPRIKKAETAPSGRAKCRHCHEAIPKESWRIALEIWEEGRFNAMGFIHMSCAPDYFETPELMDRISFSTPDLEKGQSDAIEAALGGA